MLFGLNTKDEAKEYVKELERINADPTLQKLWGIMHIIMSFQASMRMNAPVYEMPMDNVVPTSVKNYLEGNPFKYVVTSVPVPDPNIPGLLYVTTWVKITKISWAV